MRPILNAERNSGNSSVLPSTDHQDSSCEQTAPAVRKCVWPAFLLVTSISLLALAVRVHAVGAASFWYDEDISLRLAEMPLRALLSDGLRTEFNMALYYVLLHFWIIPFSTEAGARMLSVLLGVANIPAIYALGRYLFNRKTGMIAALLLALNGFHVRYSQEARSYALLALLLTLSGLFFARMLRERRRRDWAVWVALAILAVYAHFLAGLTVAAQPVSAFWLRRHIPVPRQGAARDRVSLSKLLMQGAVAIFLGAAPVAVYAIWRGPQPIRWVQPLTWTGIYDALTAITGGGGGWLMAAYGLLVLLAVISGKAHELRNADGLERWPLALLLGWAFLPPAAIILISLRQPLLVPRFLIASTPAFALLATRGIGRLPRRGIQAVAVAALVALSIPGVAAVYREAPYRNDYRDAVRYLSRSALRGDAVLIYQGWDMLSWYHYYSGPPVPMVGISHLDRKVLDHLHATRSRVWLALSQCEHKADVAEAIESVLSGQWTATRELQWGSLRLVLFQRGGMPIPLSGCR